MKRLLLLLFLLTACTHPPLTPDSMPPSDASLTLLLADSHVEPLATQKLTLIISQIHLHNENSWQTLTQNAKRYDLVQLRNTQQNKTIYETTLPPGHYDQVKLYLTQVSLTQKGKNKAAYLPSNELTIPIELEAKAGHTYTLLLNMDTLKSIYSAKYNEYVFAPQIKVTLTDQDPQEETILEQYSLGMDEQGNTEKNGHLRSDIEFRIINNKIRIVQPLLQDSNAGINLYLQSIPFGSEPSPQKTTQIAKPIHVILKEIRLQNNNTVTVYKGEQELLLDPHYVQEVASEQAPAEEYTQLKLYFEDTGRDAEENPVELTPSLVTTSANLTLREEETLNVLLRIPIEEKNKRYFLHPAIITTTSEKSIRTDAGHTGQRLYIPHAELGTIREADKEGMFRG